MEERPDHSEAIDKLSNGLLKLFEPDLKSVKSELKNLITKQNALYIDLSNEKHNFAEEELKDVQTMMSNLVIYKEKLTKIRQKMTLMHQKSKSLKKKAIEIQIYQVNEKANKQSRLLQEEALISKRPPPSGTGDEL